MEQATPTPTPAPLGAGGQPTNTPDFAQLIAQAVAEGQKPLLARIEQLEQAKTPAAPTPAAPTARPSVASTPTPSAAPAAPTQGGALAQLIEAADSGDRLALREAMKKHGRTLAPHFFGA